MGTLSQQHSLVSLLHFQQDFKSELISKRGINGEVLPDCQLIYETPELKKNPQVMGTQQPQQRQAPPQARQQQQVRPQYQQQSQQPTARRTTQSPQRRQQ